MDQEYRTLVVEGDNKEWYGAGHNTAYSFGRKDYIIYHGYDAKEWQIETEYS